jgi:hypothetical protein
MDLMERQGLSFGPAFLLSAAGEYSTENIIVKIMSYVRS